MNYISKGFDKKTLTSRQVKLHFYFEDLFYGFDLSKKANLYYHILYIVRRSAYVGIAFFLTSSGYFQIVITYYFTLLKIIFLIETQPY